ncbi:hypothetical protein AADR41_22270 [Streptomyces sp. CLV115]|uniref:hypothetical protein n=1 Tax=Streptomyces sp. CLV115 TaxID=3138502 RepID=UPI00313EA7FD
MDGHLVRAWHCTRLLDHEVDGIRGQGLRKLEGDLVEGLLLEVHRRGLLSAEQYAALRAKHSLAPGAKSWGMREGQICLALSTAAFLDNPDGFWRLLGHWRGESLYAPMSRTPIWRASCGACAGPLWRRRSSTCLIRGPTWCSPLCRTSSSARSLDNRPAHAEVFHRPAIPPEHMESIAHPGDADYGRFPGLWRV